MKPEPGYKAQKSALRTRIRQQRRALDPVKKQELDTAIQMGLTVLATELQPACIGVFWPFDGEPDLRPAVELLAIEGVRIALPVICPSVAGASMKFQQWSPGTRMVSNQYGILEPGETPDIQMIEIDLILIPLVGWDSSGARLGMGAGYYDRALQPFAQLPSPVRAGVAYQFQRVPHLPEEPWDIRLHGILSESGWQECLKTDP